MRFAFYVIFSFYITGFVYPIAAHWWLGNGWLTTQLGYVDFGWLELAGGVPILQRRITAVPANTNLGGAGPLHVMGSVVGIMCSAILGPRQGVFTERGAYIPIRSNPSSTVFGSLLLMCVGVGGDA